MVEILQIIAALCQINAGNAPAWQIETRQISCHKFYAQCLGGLVNADKLYQCIQKRVGE